MIIPYRSCQQIQNIIDVSGLAKCIQEQGVAVFFNQNLNEQQLINFCKKFGECETPGLFMNPKKFPEIFLVTNKRDTKGNKIGMFGNGELGWHSNGNSRHLIDKIMISLFCVNSDPNTTLSVCHTALPFEDLSENDKDYWRSIKIKLKFQNDTMYHLDDDDPELEFMSKNRGSIRQLVGIHPHTNREYFYFPYHFIVKAWQDKKIIDHNEMIKRLQPIIFKSKYQYHHIFSVGDLLIMDQFTTLHRRTAVADNNRLLWRIANDYQYACP